MAECQLSLSLRDKDREKREIQLDNIKPRGGGQQDSITFISLYGPWQHFAWCNQHFAWCSQHFAWSASILSGFACPTPIFENFSKSFGIFKGIYFSYLTSINPNVKSFSRSSKKQHFIVEFIAKHFTSSTGYYKYK